MRASCALWFLVTGPRHKTSTNVTIQINGNTTIPKTISVFSCRTNANETANVNAAAAMEYIRHSGYATKQSETIANRTKKYRSENVRFGSMDLVSCEPANVRTYQVGTGDHSFLEPTQARLRVHHIVIPRFPSRDGYWPRPRHQGNAGPELLKQVKLVERKTKVLIRPSSIAEISRRERKSQTALSTP